MEIGKHLRQVRESHGLMQKQLAERAGLDRSYVSKLERGLVDPTFNTLQKIAKAYNLTIGNLLNYGLQDRFTLDLDAAVDALRTLRYNMVRVEITVKPL